MRTPRRRPLITVLLMLVTLVAAGLTVARAQDRPIRIGVMNDLSSVYADFQGRGSVIAAHTDSRGTRNVICRSILSCTAIDASLCNSTVACIYSNPSVARQVA